MENQTFFFNVNSSQIWIEQISLGKESQPTLVFLHEGLGCSAMWKEFPKRLCQTVSLNGILYDRQGHGFSDPLTEKRDKQYLHTEALEILPKILDQLKIQHPILIGHSDGASIALIYAAHFKPQAIITEAAHIYVEPITLKGIKKATAAYEQTSLREKLYKYHQEKTDPLFYAWADTWLDPSFNDWSIQSLLPKIQAPSLIIQGENDPYATHRHWQDIITGISAKAEPVWLTNCGHSPHKELPELVLNTMAKFIKYDAKNQMLIS